MLFFLWEFFLGGVELELGWGLGLDWIGVWEWIGHAMLAAASHRAPFPLRSPRGLNKRVFERRSRSGAPYEYKYILPRNPFFK